MSQQELQALRDKIDDINSRLINTLQERFDLLDLICEVKRTKGLPTEDLARYQEMIEKINSHISMDTKGSSIKIIFEKILCESLEYCKKSMN